MIQWEEITLNDATHVEINGEVHEIKAGGKVCLDTLGWIDIKIDVNNWAQVPQKAFPFLGIRCLRRFKPTPIEFEATFASYDGNWHPLYSLDDGLSYQNCKKATFKCVEILEEN